MASQRKKPLPTKRALKKDSEKTGAERFWEARASNAGREKVFKTPEALWKAACEYFEWVETHPLKEHKAFAYVGMVTKTSLPIMRAMTITNLCLFIGVSHSYFESYETQLKGYKSLTDEQKEFLGIYKQIKNVVRDQKFQGAAGNLLNANLIARDLGLTDKQEIVGTQIQWNETKTYEGKSK